MIIHQIYGLFDDGKPMNDIFTYGHNKWKEYCERNGHIYKLWNKQQIEELVNTYDDIKKYYYDVKYPVMKADISRFLVLYQFGGLYVDLDCCPNKDKIFIDETKLNLADYIWGIHGKMEKGHLDMEVIYSPKYNNLLYNYIAKYVPTQIEEKNKIKVYDTWVIRYIFQTTGPASFNRWLKKNKITRKHLHAIPSVLLEENIFIEDMDMNNYDNMDFDIISHFSLSYTPHNKKVFKYKNPYCRIKNCECGGKGKTGHKISIL
jgi:hypothetical protein